MTVFLTSPVLGQDKGTAYTGPLESWLLHEGYARAHASSLTTPITVTPTAAVLTGTVNAVNIVTTGTIIFGTKDGVRTSVALTAADTPAAAATKIDTALATLADAAIVASKLQVTSIATGTEAYVSVVGGTASVLANLGVTLNQAAYGGDGRPTGSSNLGVQADTPANDPGNKANREAPYFPGTPDRHVTIANDATHLTETKLAAPNFDLDIGNANTEAPSALTVKPSRLKLAGGEKVTITGLNLEAVSGVTFGGTAGTALDITNAGDGVITVVSPVKTAGTYDVIVTNPNGATTKTGAVTYA